MNISIEKLPKFEVGFIRRIGRYDEPQEHWGQLINWALENSLFPPEQSFIGISLDNPQFVEPSHCRHDACVTIPEGFEKDRHKNMQFKEIDGGLYALFPFYDVPEQLNSAYQYMYGQWLSSNEEYEADFTRDNLEFNRNNPAEDPDGKCKVDLFVPIIKK